LSQAIVICTERGPLEDLSILLCESIREFGGGWKNVPVHSFSPRRGLAPGRTTLRRLEALGVEHSSAPLNRGHADHRFFNKLVAMAEMERQASYERLIWLDSDAFLLNEPGRFELKGGEDAALGAEHQINVGSTGPGDRNEPFWRRLYEVCGVGRAGLAGLAGLESYVTTVLERRRIRAYWNGGVAAVRADRGIFTAAARNFHLAREMGLRHRGGELFLDQAVISATVCAVARRVRTLPVGYNYPYAYEPQLRREKRALPLDRIVVLHHTTAFRQELRPALCLLRSPDCPRKRWIVERFGKLGFRLGQTSLTTSLTTS
jgi:hypothetical protein